MREPTEPTQPTQPAETISFEEFQKVKLRGGRVVEASEHPDADRLIVLQVDLGDVIRWRLGV